MPALTEHAETQNAAMQSTWDAAAAGWDDNGALIRAWLGGSTAAMLDAADIRPGHRVLDVAAGAGDQTIDIAQRVGPEGSVLAVDLSPELVARADRNLARAGCVNTQTRVGNGEALGLVAAFDAAVCRLGLMFYANPFSGLREMHAALKPGGKAAVLVFAGPECNPLIVDAMAIAARHAGGVLPDPRQSRSLLSLGDAAQLTRLFEQAGFCDVTCRTIAAPMSLPTTRHYVDFLRTAAGPVVSVARQLGPERQDELWADFHAAFARFQHRDGWLGPNELLLASGRVPVLHAKPAR